MFLNLFHSLKNLGVPVSMKEYLDLLSGLNKGVCSKNNTTEFYNFAKMALIKDEKYLNQVQKIGRDFSDIFIEVLHKVIPNLYASVLTISSIFRFYT